VAEIFICYSSRDTAFADELLGWLRQQGFTDIFKASDQDSGIAAGEEWRWALQRHMREAQVVLAVISDNWFGSDWCRGERRAAELMGKRIIPLVLEGTDPARLQQIESDPVQWIKVGPDRSEAFARLHDGLANAGLLRDTFLYDPARAPFPGLAVFEEEDAGVFFGRESDIGKALDRVRVMQQFNQPKLLVIYGGSGVGKSSLLRAGILPRLRRREAGPLRPIGPLQISAQPLGALRKALRTALPQNGAELARALDREGLEAEGEESLLARLTAAFAADSATHGRPLVVIDQLEQVLHADARERTGFLRFLSRIFRPTHSWLGIATVRSDLFPQIQSDTAFTGCEYEILTLEPLQEHRLKDVIEKPATRAGRRIEPALVDQLAQDTGATIALPFLAFTLRELYETVPPNQPWRIADYEVLGEPSLDINPIAGCVRRRANEAAFGSTPEGAFDPDLRRAFVPLMTDIGDNEQPIRRIARWSDIPTKAEPALRRLEAARICFSSVDEHDVPCIGIAHESLYSVWPPLQRAVETEKRRLGELRQAERSAQTWKEQAQSKAFLDHRGMRLVRLAQLARSADYRLRVSERLRAYIAACRRRELLVWSRRAAAVAGAAALITVFANQYNTRSQLLAAADQALAKDDPFTAGALAFAALPPPGSVIRVGEERALALMTKSSLAFARGVFEPGGSAASGRLESAAFSPDGQFLATARVGGSVVVWSTETGMAARRIDLQPGRPVQVIKYSPAGDVIAAGGADGIVTLIDTRSWQTRSGARVHTAPINALAFDRDGTSIVTASVDGTAIVWDAASLAMRGKLQLPDGDAGQLTCTAVAADGSIVVGATDNTLRRWANAADPAPKAVFSSQSQVQTCDLDHDGKRAIAGTSNGLLALIDLGTTRVTELANVVGQSVWMAAFSPDGGMVASAWQDGMLRLTATPAVPADMPMSTDIMFHRDAARSVAFDAAGKRLASASYDGLAVVWDVAALEASEPLSADQAFQSLCGSALAPRLTLWRRGAGESFMSTPDCACARAGTLSVRFWRSLATGPSPAPHCAFSGQ
jgi:WD40 repeat protein